MVCNNCGAPIEKGDKFCKHCGYEIDWKEVNDDIKKTDETIRERSKLTDIPAENNLNENKGFSISGMIRSRDKNGYTSTIDNTKADFDNKSIRNGYKINLKKGFIILGIIGVVIIGIIAIHNLTKVSVPDVRDKPAKEAVEILKKAGFDEDDIRFDLDGKRIKTLYYYTGDYIVDGQSPNPGRKVASSDGVLLYIIDRNEEKQEKLEDCINETLDKALKVAEELEYKPKVVNLKGKEIVVKKKEQKKYKVISVDVNNDDKTVTFEADTISNIKKKEAAEKAAEKREAAERAEREKKEAAKQAKQDRIDGIKSAFDGAVEHVGDNVKYDIQGKSFFVTYDVDGGWSETLVVQNAITDYIKTAEAIYDETDINDYRLFMNVLITDEKGNDKMEHVFTMGMRKKVYNSFNWDNLKEQGATVYPRLNKYLWINLSNVDYEDLIIEY